MLQAIRFFLFLVSFLVPSLLWAQTAAPARLHLADPAIFKQGKMYYLYGTVEGASDKGFRAYQSDDLRKWQPALEKEALSLEKGSAFGLAGFWAPQVLRYNDKYLMAYVANEQIAFAWANNPAGPFTQKNIAPLAAPVKQIDPFLFVEGEKKYLYHVRLGGGNKIFVAEMNDALDSIKEETLRECIAATEPWENTAGAQWPVAEGPTVLKHKDLYYLIYSANDFRNPDYAVGYATSPHPLGPWTKYTGNPIISRKLLGHNGTGHGDLFWQGKNMYYVLHTHNSNTTVGPRNTALIQLRFVPVAGGADVLTADAASFRFLEVKDTPK